MREITSLAGVALLRTILLIVGALFPIVNPLGNAPIFLSLTRDYSSAIRTVLARKIAINGFILLIVSLLIGTNILDFFGISLPVVQVGGGLVVIATGWKLLNRRDEEAPQRADHPPRPSDIAQRAFYPLTLPLTVGPGSISVAIAVGANRPAGRRHRLASARSRVRRGGRHRREHLPELPVCRNDRAGAGGSGNERRHPAVIVHSALYRCADRVERRECAAADGGAARVMALKKEVFGWDAGIRTPIGRVRVCSPTVGRRPSTGFHPPPASNPGPARMRLKPFYNLRPMIA